MTDTDMRTTDALPDGDALLELIADATARQDHGRATGTIEVVDVDDDGRTVYGRMFPIGERARVTEPLEGGRVAVYDEMFLPGCTMAMRQVAQRRGDAAWIRFRIDHGDDFHREVGFCRALEELQDGAYGTFRLWDGEQLPKVRSMLTESHRGLSVEFRDKARPKLAGRVVQRVSINVSHVAATPSPVYANAGILEVRADEDPTSGTPNLDRVRALLAELGIGELNQ